MTKLAFVVGDQSAIEGKRMGCNEHVHGFYGSSLAFQNCPEFSILLGSHVVVGRDFERRKQFGQGNSVLLGP